MSIQMALFGGQGKSQITAQTSVVSSTRIRNGSVSIGFLTSGQQVEVKNGNTSVIGNWVNPSTKAADWEIRAVLDSGDTPTGTLGTWLSLSSNREWSFSVSSPESLSCVLTFEFRRVGDTSAEVTIPNNSLSIEILETF